MKRFIRWNPWRSPAEAAPHDPLEDALRTYGEHLTMTPQRRLEVRETVLAEFRRAGAATGAAATDRGRPRAWWRPLAGVWPRPVAAAAVVVMLLLSGSGLVAAQSGPGQPFYGFRTSLERVTPPWATPAQRVASNLQFLDGRLNDLQSSAQRSNASGMAAAIAAYEAGLQEMLQNGELPGADPAQAARTLDQRAAVLHELLGRVPAAAKPGLENALTQTNQVGEKLQQLGSAPPGLSKGGPGPASGHGQAGATPGAQGGGTDNGVGNAGQPGNGGANRSPEPGTRQNVEPSHRPGNDHRPTPTPSPTPTPTPSPTPTPTPSPTPTPTPSPTPTPNPGQGEPAG